MKLDRKTVVIGWSESVDFPDWGIRGLRAKVDTGARSSALDVEGIEETGRGTVSFDVVVNRRAGRRVRVEARVVRRGRVRASTGVTTERLFVRTTLRLGPVERTVELNLVDRGRMTHRAILGRTALGPPIRIDASRRDLLRPRRQ